MCVAIPGEVIEIKKDSDFLHGVVSFGGIKKIFHWFVRQKLSLEIMC